LERRGIRTVGQIQALSRGELERKFGDWAETLHRLARGEDTSEVTPLSEAKSLSAETTFATDVKEPAVLKASLYALVERVGRRLRQQALVGRTVVLKIRWPSFQLMTRNRTLPRATNLDETIFSAAWGLAVQNGVPGRPVRLLGAGLHGLESESEAFEPLLFTIHDESPRLLTASLDAIRDKYGEQAVRHARTLYQENREK
jgi:DNA polymerase-4